MAGSILARLLYKEGIEFRAFDCLRKGRASFVSENLIGVKWYEDEKRQRALGILDGIVQIRQIISEGKGYHHVYRSDLLLGADMVIQQEAEFLKDGVISDGVFYPGVNIDCRGVWSPNQKTKVGHGLFMSGKQIEWIKDYKPFRLLKFIEHSPGVMWFSNSMDVLLKTYSKELFKFRDELLNARDESQTSQHHAYEFGYRPDGEKAIKKQPYGYQMSGGYKSGLVDYPIMATELIKLLKYEHAI